MAYRDLAGKQRLEKLEELEGELQGVAIEEIGHVIDVASHCPPTDAEGRKTLMQQKSQAANTLSIMAALARYSGLKRGNLARSEFGSPGNYPQADVERAQAIVNRLTKAR